MSNINFNLSILFASALGATAFTACGGMERDFDDDGQLAETSDALCTDNGIANVTKTLTGGGSVSAVSGTSYDGGACDSFLFQANGIENLPGVVASAEWPNDNLTQDSCATALLVSDFYGYNGSAWIKIGHSSDIGSWHPSVTACDRNSGQCLTFGAYCSIGASKTIDSTQYTKVRVGAKASSAVWPVPLQVKTVVSSIIPPA